MRSDIAKRILDKITPEQKEKVSNYAKSLTMNTINNPLILKKRLSNWTYEANKPWDQSGSYVDLKLAEEMLSLLEQAAHWFEFEPSMAPTQHTAEKFNKLILKAKGE